jgi:hypothetical protein
MNLFHKRPIESLGFDFIEPKFLPKGKNEYHLRNKQRADKSLFSPLTIGITYSYLKNSIRI